MSGVPEMIERVAQAIHAGIQDAAERELTARGSVYPKPLAFGDLSGEVRDGYRATARAAIEAMREPTEMMVDAGTPYSGWSDRDGLRDGAREGFRVMIDAALKAPAKAD